ncbi:MAG: hypothetical protein ACRCSZ_03300 [Lactococcus lactis]
MNTVDGFKVGDVWEMMIDGHHAYELGEQFEVVYVDSDGDAKTAKGFIDQRRIAAQTIKLVSRVGESV